MISVEILAIHSQQDQYIINCPTFSLANICKYRKVSIYSYKFEKGIERFILGEEQKKGNLQ